MKQDPIKRFHKYVILNSETGCWEWIGAKNKKGYGVFDKTKAHRFSFLYYKGVELDNLQINHKCRVKSCVNPDHLEAVTYKQHRVIDNDLILAGCSKGGKLVGRILGKSNKQNDLPEGVYFNHYGKGLLSRIHCPFIKKSINLKHLSPVTPEHIQELSELYQKARAEIDQFGRIVSWPRKKKDISEENPNGDLNPL